MKIEQDSEFVPDSELSEHNLQQINGGEVSAERTKQIFDDVYERSVKYSEEAAKKQGVSVKARAWSSFTRTGLEFGALFGGGIVADKAIRRKGN